LYQDRDIKPGNIFKSAFKDGRPLDGALRRIYHQTGYF